MRCTRAANESLPCVLPQAPRLHLWQLEREEFFRLKRSQDKKKKDIALRAAEKLAEAQGAAAQASMLEDGGMAKPADDVMF